MSVVKQLDTPRGVFRVALSGPEDGPVLMLSNSLGTTLEMWAPQVPFFSEHYRVLRYDTRGHGESEISPAPYTFEGLGQDVLAILDALEIDKAAFCGLSMGGHLALWLGIHAPERMHAIVACNTAAKIGTQQAWQERAELLRAQGQAAMQQLADTAPERWFTEAFTQQQPEIVQPLQKQLAALDPLGYAACCDALGSSDLREELAKISLPTLIITGDKDPVTTVQDAQALQDAIPNARMAVLLASHISNVESEQAFNEVVSGFLRQVIRS